MRETPREIYEQAIRERKSSNALNRRQACEKGWLAVVEAVDNWLKVEHGKHVPKGTDKTHVKRNKILADLAHADIPGAAKLEMLLSTASNQLHGTCFYSGEDSPHFTTLLKKDVKQVLELTGFWDGD